MKILITLSLFLSSYLLSAQQLNRTFPRANGAIHILGQASLDRLQEDPFQEWYAKSYGAYEVDKKTIESTQLPDSVTIFMGTWCGDSKREVPRFIKILEHAEFNLDKLKIVCLNTGFQNYKQAPEREESGLNIHRVPTFIFHDEEQSEIGRIVEEPVTSLEKDFKEVMDGNLYETAYPVANDLINKFDTYSLKELRKMMPSLVNEYKGKAANEYELNTYGYVLWAAFDLMKAEFVLELNTKLYPESTVPFSTLVRFKENLGKRKEALAGLKKGLTIDPENERLLALKADME